LIGVIQHDGLVLSDSSNEKLRLPRSAIGKQAGGIRGPLEKLVESWLAFCREWALWFQDVFF